MGKGGKTVQNNNPWSKAQPYMEGVLQDGAQMYLDGGLAPTPYAGERVADLSDMTLGGIGSLGSAINPSAISASYGMSDPTKTGLRQLEGVVDMGGYRQGANRANAVYNDTRDLWSDMTSMDQTYRDFDTIRGSVADQTKAALGGTFAGGGLESGLAQQTYAQGLGNALANVEYGAYNDAQNRRLAAMGFAPQLQGMGQAANDYLTEGRGLRAQSNLAAGDYRDQRDIDRTAAANDARERAAKNTLFGGGILDMNAQMKADAAKDYWDETQQQPIDNFMNFANLTMGMGGQGGTSSGSQDPSTMDQIGQAAQTAGWMYALYSMSDRRLKTNIRKIGETQGGTNIYAYDFLGTPTFGVMSDEVPHAVAGQIGGYDVVDYGKVR